MLPSMSHVFAEASANLGPWRIEVAWETRRGTRVSNVDLSDDSADVKGLDVPESPKIDPDLLKDLIKSTGGKFVRTHNVGSHMHSVVYAFDTAEQLVMFVMNLFGLDDADAASYERELKSSGHWGINSTNGYGHAWKATSRAKKGEKTRAQEFLEKLEGMGKFSWTQAHNLWLEMAGKDINDVGRSWGTQNVFKLLRRFGEKQADGGWVITKAIEGPFMER